MQPGVERSFRHGPGEQVALPAVATEALEHDRLVDLFDTLGHGFEAE